ncbi:MAG: hypothetical protein KCHDKBKB_00921 [Elusimicrobia bacterium]|nr:hypothetical protein [Elusimicrobiota bacterium]
MKRKVFFGILVAVLLFAIGLIQFFRTLQTLPPPTKREEEARPPAVRSLEETVPSINELEKTKNEMLAYLNQTEAPNRRLILPSTPNEVEETAKAPPSSPPPLTPRAIGRKKRQGLPMGVVLWDNVPVYDSVEKKRVIFSLRSGDVVRVFDDNAPSLAHVQPGLDIYLAATTKETQPAGEFLPDQDGWVEKTNLHVFEPDAAKEFVMETTPVTLGNDTDFSTFDFYDRAMKNPDPVVHRMIGPRMIALVLLHEDYSSSWATLYRDQDPRIRDAALAALNERGVGDNRELIEDLILRLTELTKFKAKGETELEVLSLLGVLKASQHPRVPAALASFKEDWEKTQSPALNEALQQILK